MAVVCCSLCAVYCLWLLSNVRCVLFAVCCVPCDVLRCLLFVVCCVVLLADCGLACGVGNALFVAPYLLNDIC